MYKNTNNIYTKLHRVCSKCGSYNINKTTDRNLFLCHSCKARFSKEKIKKEINFYKPTLSFRFKPNLKTSLAKIQI
jgi:ribosomal protein L37AE/L43A